MNTISCQDVYNQLKETKYNCKDVTLLPEGSNHYVFDVLLDDGSDLICKFAKVRATEKDLVENNTDTLYGGRLSLEREAYLYSLVKEKAQLPAPNVFGIHQSPIGDYILVEKMLGESHYDYIKKSNYSLKAFLKSMNYLGQDFAKVQGIQFPTYGDVMAKGEVSPPAIDNFADRFIGVMENRLHLAEGKKTFNPRELDEVSTFFHHQFNSMRNVLDIGHKPAALIFTDMHVRNFFVDDTGCPSGYFDLESCQAAPAALEFYGFNFFIFNFFDSDTFSRSQDAFLEGYSKAGGGTALLDDSLVHLLAGCRLLELAESYWGIVDGLRDKWGEQFKKVLFNYMESGVVDYLAVGDIFRQRDRQPLRPTE
jgi:phosphotransferase family enzyme